MLSGAKYVFDDTNKKTSPYKTNANYSPIPNHTNFNGNTIDTNAKHCKFIQDYVKPKSPVKGKISILTHDNIPGVNTNGVKRNYVNGGANDGTIKPVNGVKGNRNISWNKDVPIEKMTFTMRREIDKAREETDLINHLRNVSICFLLFIIKRLY